MKRRADPNVPVLYFKEGKMFVAYCPILDLSTCGPTFDEAEKNFRQALDIFFEECVKHGTLAQALTSLGWQKVESRPPYWKPPIFVGEERLPVHVPAST